MKSEILLGVMPNCDVGKPSLAMGLLKAALDRIGIPSTVAYWNFLYAERIGLELYTEIVDNDSRLGDWLFSHTLFGHSAEVSDQYLDLLALNSQRSPASLEKLRHAREMADPFLEEILQQADWNRYRMVGLTTAFQQNTATLALAWRIKELNPEIQIVLGGANCASEMGRQILNLFPFVDFVCLGEGDLAFPQLAQALHDGGTIERLPAGMIGRLAGEVIQDNPPSRLVDLDELPFPDFDDYFEALEKSPLRGAIDPQLVLETSRGCWWGEKHQCTFCGLNAREMPYRRKSSERALEEIRTAAARYGPRMGDSPTIAFADNILDLSYFKTVVAGLKEIPFRFYYETKANLKKSQVEMLADAGVGTLQPGIESLSSSVLALMDKGCNALQNIQLLKWCNQFGIFVLWNILSGFPDEDPKEYASQCDLMTDLHHLAPPDYVGRFVLERFSPYFEDPQKYGIINVRPNPAYRYIYPFPERETAHLVFDFSFDFATGYDPDAHTRVLQRTADEWKKGNASEYLYATDVDQTLVIWDGRESRTPQTHTLAGIPRLVYLYCDEIRGLRAIENYVVDGGGAAGMCLPILEEFVRVRLMVREGDRYLSLAVLLIQGELPTGNAEVSRPSQSACDVALESTFRPADHISSTEVGGRLALLDVRRRQLHSLNEMASVVWDCCATGMSVGNVLKNVCECVAWDPDVVRADTLGVIHEFARRELLVPAHSGP